MAVKTLVSYGDTGGIVTADTTASVNTVVLRDSGGNIAAVQVAATEQKTTGTVTLSVKAAQTASITLDSSAVVWPFDTTSGSLVPTLPPAATVTGRKYTIIKTVAANSLTITGNGSENINGANTKVLSAQWATATVVSNGTGWYITALI